MKKFLVFLSLSFMFLSCTTTVDLEKDFFQEEFEDDLQSDEFFQNDELTGTFVVQDKYIEDIHTGTLTKIINFLNETDNKN